MDTDEVSSDFGAIRAAVRTILKVIWINVSSEGSALLEDFASFARLAMADFAEAIEQQAGHTKEGLRSLDTQVQEGDRDNLGRKKKPEDEQKKDFDPKAQWESGMDTAKYGGSKAIGAGQEVKATAEETADRTGNRLHGAYIKVRLFSFLLAQLF